MGEKKNYVVVGRGRWARRMAAILSGEGRSVTLFAENRRADNESPSAYIERMASRFAEHAGQIAWLCVPPGPHVVQMLRAAVLGGIHCVVEKPWFGSETETAELIQSSRKKNLWFAAHYEYCVLEEVQRWQRDLNEGSGLTFCGRFFLNRPNHWEMSALDNLGSHLLSIREFAVPLANITEVYCAYDQPDVREVDLSKGSSRVAHLDLLASKEPIIQHFVAGFENAVHNEKAWPLDLLFASRVAKTIALIKEREAKASSEPSSSSFLL